MRMRKKKWAMPELEQCGFYVAIPHKCIGKWNEMFEHSQNQIHLELGCGKGVSTSIMASQNPNINYMAIDISSNVLGVAQRNVVEEYRKANIPINNILLMSYDIERIDEILNKDDKVNRIYINFCNPWPKKRHKKRRLTHTRQLLKYKTFVSDNAELFFKTDDDELFEETLEYLAELNMDISYLTRDLENSDYVGNIETEHEKMFKSQGIKIKFLIAHF